MLIAVKKSTGELLTDTGGSYGYQTRGADDVPVRSSVPVAVRFYADDQVTRVLLDAATGTLTFSGQPADGDTFLVGTTTYTAKTTLPTTGADEVLLGANLSQFIANLAGAVNGATTGGQIVGTTYSTGTSANPLATAAALGNAILFTAASADASGNSVLTATTSAHGAFSAPTLTGGDVLNLDIKPQGQYDLTTFTLPSPAFAAPADPALGDYTGVMSTLVAPAEALLDPNDADGTTPAAIEPDDEPLMAQVSWGPLNTPPTRSDQWTINLVNVVRHGGEGVPVPAPGLTLAQVTTAVAQAAAATAALAALSSNVDGGTFDTVYTGSNLDGGNF